MCGQNSIDDMNEILLSGEPFIYNGFDIRMVDNRRNYEIRFNNILLEKVPCNWSTYWMIEDMITNERN
jgi:hypothetical protein